MMFGKKFVVYTMHGDDVVLYIGRTSRLQDRLRVHASRSEWWSQVRRYEIEFFDTYGSAFNAERAAILARNPVWNRAKLEPHATEPDDPHGVVADSVVYLKTPEAARRVKLGPSTLRTAARDGRLQASHTTPGGHYRWDLADLRRQLDAIRRHVEGFDELAG